MINYIRGTLRQKNNEYIVVEIGGLGFEIYMSTNSNVYLSDVGDDVTVYTQMIVREDDISLYGFSDRDELGLFKKLITVSGIGAKVAIGILSSMPTHEIVKAIAFEDEKSLMRANGVGKKSAQRIILELRDKMEGIEASYYMESGVSPNPAAQTDDKSEALNALVVLGYSKSEAASALSKVNPEGLSTEDIIKQALKNLF